MLAVILGAGNVGFNLAKQLIGESMDVVLIEKDPKRAAHASRLLDCMVINEVGTKLSTFEEAGIENAGYFIGITDSDEINMIACAMVACEYPDTTTASGPKARSFDQMLALSPKGPGRISYACTLGRHSPHPRPSDRSEQ